MTFRFRIQLAEPGLLVLAVSAVGLGGCDAAESRYAVVDTPTPIPSQVEGPPRPPDEVNEPDPELVAKCVRGTGRNAQGECEALRRQELDHVQRIQLPRGDFVMGDIPVRYDASKARKEPKSSWSGNPPRQAHVEAYWLDFHEVTRSAYAKCVADGKCTEAKCAVGQEPKFKQEGDELGQVPQTCVTHAQAEAFCQAHGGRLPTEAEWEFAARGVDARIFPWGNDVRDEYRQALLPVTGPVDLSYFGMRGMGTNAIEWVAETFELDAGLAAFVSEPFRDPQGPLAKWRSAQGEAHVVKGGRAGARSGQAGPASQTGFRCAADLAPDETPLDTPDPSVAVPLVVNGAGVQFFGGVAEATTRREAEAFCAALSVPAGGEALTGWRLPTFDEVSGNAGVFRGPGPFWTQASAAEQQGEGPRVLPDDPWVSIDVEPAEALAARCIRP